MINQQIVEALWAAFDRFEFEAVAPLLSDDFICDWPQSRERIRGRENFIAVQKFYPGKWRCTVKQIIVSGDTVITETAVSDGAVHNTAISFFTLRDGLIVHLREYWPDPMDAQAWRAQWVEQMPDGV